MAPPTRQEKSAREREKIAEVQEINPKLRLLVVKDVHRKDTRFMLTQQLLVWHKLL